MNIFVLSDDPFLSAQLHCDKHVVKMTLETAQIISTIARKNGVDFGYKPTHENHPSVVWAGDSWSNFIWTCNLFRGLCGEYTVRFGKIHKCEKDFRDFPLISIRNTFGNFVLPLSSRLCSNPPQCMPDQYKDVNPVVAYRRYYRGEKRRFAKWTVRSEPEWMTLPDEEFEVHARLYSSTSPTNL